MKEESVFEFQKKLFGIKNRKIIQVFGQNLQIIIELWILPFFFLLQQKQRQQSMLRRFQLIQDRFYLFPDFRLFGQINSDHEFFRDKGNNIIFFNVFLGSDNPVARSLFNNLNIFKEAIVGFEVLEELLELIFSLWNFCFPWWILLCAPQCVFAETATYFYFSQILELRFFFRLLWQFID